MTCVLLLIATMAKSKKLALALHALKHLPKQRRQQALRNSSPQFIKDLSSAVRKLRVSKVSPNVQRRLSKHRALLRCLCNSKTSIKKKRQALVQRGGVLPFLVPIIVASIGAAGSVGAAAAGAALSK